jgi:hypothetical protein
MLLPSARPDPLLLFLLASIGAVTGCEGMDIGSPAACEDPTPHLSDATGYTSCNNGFTHRPTAASCERHAPRSGVLYPSNNTCHGDADCADLPNGRCIGREAYLGFEGCVSECEFDSDCASGEICFCGAEVNRCQPATCTSDADCGAGLLCASYGGGCASGTVAGFACQMRTDECTTDADCDGDIAQCQPGEGGRVCVTAACGRPFLVAGAPRLARTEVRSDYLVRSAPLDTASLSVASRIELAERWTRMALMEHASIAAFARFTLELLAVGAPAALVAEAARALADEQRHAVLCFGVASEYAGHPVGPGVLEISDCAPATELERVVETTFLEGCLGETLAAVEARELAESASEPTLAELLRTIADDESRHAALAFRFVRWALERDRGLVPLIERLTAEALEHAEQDGQLRAATVRGVVAPCVRELLRSESRLVRHGTAEVALGGDGAKP